MDVSIYARINDDNLRPFLSVLGLAIDYVIDGADWTALDYGTQPSNLNGDTRFCYPLGGVEVLIAHDVEESEYEIEIRHTRDRPTLPAFVAAAEYLCMEYTMSDPISEG